MGRNRNVADSGSGHPEGTLGSETARQPRSDQEPDNRATGTTGGPDQGESRDPDPVQDRNGLHPSSATELDATFGTVIGAEEPYGLPGDPGRLGFPRLWPWLTRLKLPSGKLRSVSRISIVAVRTGFSVTLQDVTLGYKLSVRAETLPDVFQALEDELCKPMPGWMPIDYGEGFVERKRKAKEDMDKSAGKR